jgi:radical SAM superfamily enzyme YgiQ (UPF0313 family)
MRTKLTARPSLLLVSPAHAVRNLWTLKEVGELLGKGVTSYPLALPYLAALTPPHWDVTLIDEEMDPVPIGERPDLVGVTAMATNVRRAYEIADAFRRDGVTVVMGGPFTTLDWRTSLAHADAVVVGEAEGLWEKLLRDFEAGKLEQVYEADGLPDISRLSLPRWDLVDTRKILAINVQISRGCPNACEFCCVTRMFGSRQRYRDVDNVIAEIRSLPMKQVSFVDDNLTSNKRYARELMARLKPLGVTWNCLAGVDVADDEALLQDMAAAGCTSILIGFESLDRAGLAQARKRRERVEDYGPAIERVHAAGIHVIGAFVAGFDSDTLDTFDGIEEFARAHDLSYVMLNLLTAFPGTVLHARMAEQGRLLDLEPEQLNGLHPTIRHPAMTPGEMRDRYWKTLARLYSYEELRPKALAVIGNGKFRARKTGVGLDAKVRGTVAIARSYLLTRDRVRRRLLVDLMSLTRKALAPADVIVEYLLFVAAANLYLSRTMPGRRGEEPPSPRFPRFPRFSRFSRIPRILRFLTR